MYELLYSTTMSTTISMPSTIESAIKSMCEDAIGQSIRVLSSKYGFDECEALREVSVNVTAASGKSASRIAVGDKKTATEPKAKRAVTGYLLYTKQLRPEVRAELEADPANADSKVKPTDVVTALAKRWKALSDDEKSNWNAKAKSDAETSDEDSLSVSSRGPAEKSTKAKPKAESSSVKPPEGFTSHDGWVPKEPFVEHKPPQPAESVKKRQSGYLLFGKEMRSDIKKAMETELKDGEKLKPQAVVGEIAAQWKALTDDARATWNDKAKTPPTSDESSD